LSFPPWFPDEKMMSTVTEKWQLLPKMGKV